jgi:hypothetical protein
MSDYLYSDDGNIHTRYTELVRCTPGQIDRVIEERLNPNKRFKSDKLDFGSDRHEMWEEESKQTHRLPACFGLDWPVSHAEHEFASKVLPGVVLHSRPDAVCADIYTLVDYKTIIADTLAEGSMAAVIRYKYAKQLPVYAYQLGLHGIRIKRIAYLVEVWNRNQDEILGYKTIIRDLTMAEIAQCLPWIKDRVVTLASAIEMEVMA